MQCVIHAHMNLLHACFFFFCPAGPLAGSSPAHVGYAGPIPKKNKKQKNKKQKNKKNRKCRNKNFACLRKNIFLSIYSLISGLGIKKNILIFFCIYEFLPTPELELFVVEFLPTPELEIFEIEYSLTPKSEIL